MPVQPSTALCEVEIEGHIAWPRGYRPTAPMTVVALGDCLDPKAKVLGFSGSTNGRFFVEVFTAWGSDLSLCAFDAPGPGHPATMYGKAVRPMHAEATGEVVFKDVDVVLSSGPPRAFSTERTAP